MRSVSINLYQYDELPTDQAKEAAKDWLRNLIYTDSCDWENVIEDAVAVAKILGIEMNTYTVMTVGGKSRQAACVWFAMNEGAVFDASYLYAKGSAKAIRDYAPQDTTLHAIADTLETVQKRNFYQLGAVIDSHHLRLSVNVKNDADVSRTVSWGDERTVVEAMRDFANWIFKQVNDDYAYQMSDEAIVEQITANEYEFYESGERATLNH